MQATIYVTDDEPAIRSAIVKRLSRRHHTVTGFESGEDVIRAVTQHAPDLILLDLKMPGMGGVETLRQLRPIAPQTLIIMLTAYGTVEDAVSYTHL
ncbi:MAG TPA: Fis family transcriptional regulator, partial [Nitrospira sp.]|nr:Fis family transcriptional regulator [Nitrospira sp.]